MSNIYEVFNVTNDHELSKIFDRLELSYNEMTNIDYIVETMNKENARTKILELMAGSADGNYEICLEQFGKSFKKRVLKEESGLNLNQVMELNQLVELVAAKLTANQQQCLEGLYNIIVPKAGENIAKTFIGMVQQSAVNQSSLKFNTDLVVDGKNLAQTIYALKNEIEIFCNSVKKEESEKEEVKESLNESYSKYQEIVQELDRAVDDVNDLNILKNIADKVNELMGRVKNMNEANELAALKTTLETKMNSLMGAKPQLEESCLATQMVQNACGEDTFNGLLDGIKPTLINITVNKDGDIIPCEDNCCEEPCCDCNDNCCCEPCCDCEDNCANEVPCVQPLTLSPTAVDAPILRKPNSAEVTSAITALASHQNDIKSDSRENNIENLQTINTLLNNISNYFNELLGESVNLNEHVYKAHYKRGDKIKNCESEDVYTICSVKFDYDNREYFYEISKPYTMNDGEEAVMIYTKPESVLDNYCVPYIEGEDEYWDGDEDDDKKPLKESFNVGDVIVMDLEKINRERPDWKGDKFIEYTIIGETSNQYNLEWRDSVNGNDLLSHWASKDSVDKWCKLADNDDDTWDGEEELDESLSIPVSQETLDLSYPRHKWKNINEEDYEDGDYPSGLYLVYVKNIQICSVENGDDEDEYYDENGEGLFINVDHEADCDIGDEIDNTVSNETGCCTYSFQYRILKKRINEEDSENLEDDTNNEDYWDGDEDLNESVENDISIEEKEEVERLFTDILRDEDSYPDYDSLKDGMRSLHSDGAITDAQYNYCLNHWNELLRLYEDEKIEDNWDGDELDEALTYAEKVRSDINIEDYKNSLIGKKFKDKSTGTEWEITKVKCVDYGKVRENLIYIRQEGDDREYISVPSDLKEMFGINIDDLLPDDYDDGEDEEELNEETVYDHSWYEVEGQKYPKRTKNGVEIKESKENYIEKIHNDFLKGKINGTEAIEQLDDCPQLKSEQISNIIDKWIDERDENELNDIWDNDEFDEDTVNDVLNDILRDLDKYLDDNNSINTETVCDVIEKNMRKNNIPDESFDDLFAEVNDKLVSHDIRMTDEIINETCSAGATCAASVASVPSVKTKKKSKPRKPETADLSLFKESIKNDCPATLSINGNDVAYKITEGKGYLYINNGIVKTLDKNVMLETIDDVYNGCVDIEILEGFNSYDLNILLEDDMNPELGDVNSTTTITPDEKKKQQQDLDNNLKKNPTTKVGVVTGQNDGEVKQNQEFVGIDDSDQNNKKYIVKDPATGEVRVVDYNQIKLTEI